MNLNGWRRGVGLLVVCALAACSNAGASPTPADGGTTKAGAKKTPSEREVERGLSDEGGAVGIGSGSGGLGTIRGKGVESYPECMPAADAQKRTKPPRDEPETGGRAGVAPVPNKEIPECATFIWTWVGAGHGSRPVGNVRAPLGLAATRKARKRGKNECCYMIPPSPGRPNG